MPLEVNVIESPIVLARPKYVVGKTAWLEHAPFAFYLTSILEPKVFVEVGTDTGESYFTFCQAVDELGLDCQCYGIACEREAEEINRESNGALDPADFQGLQDYNQSNYADYSQLIHSPWKDGLDRLSDGSVDVLHVNGLANFLKILRSFAILKSKLSPAGVIVLSGLGDCDIGAEIWQRFAVLKSKYPHFYFPQGHGLLILGLGAQQKDVMRPWFNASSQEGAKIQTLFARLGHLCQACGQQEQVHNQLSQEREQNQKVQRELAVAQEHQELLSIELEDAKFGELQLQEELKASQKEVQQLQSELESVRQENAKALESLERSHQEEMEAAERSHQEGDEKRLEEVRRLHRKELVDLRQQYEMRLKERQRLHGEELQAVRLAYEGQLSEIGRSHQEGLSAAKNQMENVEFLLEQKIIELAEQAEVNRDIQQKTIQLETQLKSLQQECERMQQDKTVLIDQNKTLQQTVLRTELQLKESQDKFQLHKHLVQTGLGQEKLQYMTLLLEGWYAYQSGNLKDMTTLLQKAAALNSLAYTELVLEWLQYFASLSSQYGKTFDPILLVESEEWRLLLHHLQEAKHV